MEALVYAVLGIAVVILTSVIKQEKWSKRNKQTASAVLSFVGGIVTAYFQNNGSVDLAETLNNSAVLLAVAQLVYSYGMRDTKLNKFLTSLHLESTLDKNETVAEAAAELLQEVTAEVKPAPRKRAAKKAITEDKTTE